MGVTLSAVAAPVDIDRTEFKDCFTAKEKALLENSWKNLVENCPEAGVTFYLHLFEKCPATKLLFPYGQLSPEEMKADPLFQGQSQRILQGIGSILACVVSPHACSMKADETVQILGARHVEFKEYHIKYMTPFAEAFLDMLEQELGSRRWSRRTGATWRRFMAKTSNLMRHGARTKRKLNGGPAPHHSHVRVNFETSSTSDED